MVAKLCPDVLDKLDIFVLEIEELEIPKVIKNEYWNNNKINNFNKTSE